MSTHDSHQSNSVPIIYDNWRKLLGQNQRILNCPCRGNKRDYLRLDGLLKHVKKNHPDNYDEVKRHFSKKDFISNNGNTSAVPVEITDDADDNMVYTGSASAEIDFTMEDPSSITDVYVDDDLESNDEMIVENIAEYEDDFDPLFESDGETEDEDEVDDVQYFDDYRNFTNVILPLSARINSATTVANEGSLPGINQIQQDIHSDNEDLLPLDSTGSSPYRNMVEFLLHALFFGDEDLSSERSMKKIMYAMTLLLELKEKDPTLKMPADDSIFNYQRRMKNRIPVFKTTEHTGVNKKTGKNHSFFMNKPSEYMKHIIADPRQAPKVTALPDETTGELISLQQGEKWRKHEMFQHPMLTTSAGQDLWIGDVEEIPGTHSPGTHSFGRCFLLIAQFFTKKHSDKYLPYARGYQVIPGVSFNNALVSGAPISQKDFGVSIDMVDILVDHVGRHIDKTAENYRKGGCYIQKIDQNVFHVVDDQLTSNQFDLWYDRSFFERYKRRKPDNTLMKVINAPVIAFSDDTSGNRSKQNNKYDSFLMVPAAMSFEERSARQNHFFICTSNKNLSAVEMLPPIVDDLYLLEKGIEMYTAQHDQYVLVVSPLLFISGDNPRHSQLAMHKGTNSSHYCRKCFLPTPANPNKRRKDNLVGLDSIVHDGYPKRTKSLLRQFCNAPVGTEEYDLGNRLSCSKNGSEELLRLESFDATLDTPVELLHCVSLGVMRYLVTLLIISNILNQEQKNRIQSCLDDYRASKAFSRTFRNEMRHCGSFVGRDFKQLMQVLPLVLRTVFGYDNNRLEPVIASFVCLGRFSSLIYVRQVPSNSDTYIDYVKYSCSELVSSLLALDNHVIDLHITNPSNISLKPKVHLLTHLHEDIIRFGCALHYETEKGEQFNKFIREHLFQTNRQSTSRDVAVRFGKQFMFRFIYNGGTFLVSTKKRGEKNKIHRIQAGYLIAKLKENHPEFDKHFLEGRQNEDYSSDYIPSTSLCNEKSGLFNGIGDRLFFATVRVETTKSGRRNVYHKFVQPYLPAPCQQSALNDIMLPFVLTVEKNVVFEDRLTGEIPWNDSFELIEVLDMETPFPAIPGGRLINVSKFGSFWCMLKHFHMCHSHSSIVAYFSGYKNQVASKT
ncbi:hypothetical protein INT47_008245 [Mucor saturninus]|uniref:Uncharacterized protein n=1 Tax=Mucor saturninus TaxID=64648 RepID=A0A8H7QH23_9FUNG|nr:hypothetical protein INT47_008245 [Mucor saturninus]